jgi:catechol 2,3-dioxygenase-like lactoylglutathione lyase family enzyme
MLADYPVVAMIACHDVERARQFYEGKLGLTPIRASLGDVTYMCKGETMFALYPSSFAGTAQSTAMTWAVDDAASAVSELRARGVVFEEYDFPGLKTVNSIAEFPGGRAAWFKDTEGNILAVTQLD